MLDQTVINILGLVFTVVIGPSVAWGVGKIIAHGEEIETIKKEIEIRVQAARDNNEKVQKAIEEMMNALAVIREDVTKIRIKLGVDT